jgi:hypothetical protein
MTSAWNAAETGSAWNSIATATIATTTPTALALRRGAHQFISSLLSMLSNADPSRCSVADRRKHCAGCKRCARKRSRADDSAKIPEVSGSLATPSLPDVEDALVAYAKERAGARRPLLR